MTDRFLVAAVVLVAACSGPAPAPGPGPEPYPWHTRIVSTTFWVGEVFDPRAEDGSQVESSYDAQWLAHYGGCDGVERDERCDTEPRTAANGYFPTVLAPRENPFYLDLPFDDVNDPGAFGERAVVVPWAGRPEFAGKATDPSVSLMKNRWVEVRRGDRVCYGQIEDAGPGVYDDSAYVFSTTDTRPANSRYNGAGLDVSPALNGCLGFGELNGETDLVDWRFAENDEVPPGPWQRIITTSGVTG
ncbi:hypothetical protein FPZ12_016010 [Amycolatopsis acidicola]|uniref:Uncharacterized protein n=1 Tax=Amycolatopsis acidicola TaxID=2596893 RepID=A0A5N0V8Q7_9PSEU|nr:hypothetical protein [Amycolatopsis acidicola]KAA9160912.1 hypothetical protein FPZ12_016010 [Amycolatopsis acidicola]